MQTSDNLRRDSEELKRLKDAMHQPTPEMIAAAWREFRRKNDHRLGPGPGFVEAIKAACAAALKGS